MNDYWQIVEKVLKEDCGIKEFRGISGYGANESLYFIVAGKTYKLDLGLALKNDLQRWEWFNLKGRLPMAYKNGIRRALTRALQRGERGQENYYQQEAA